MTPTRRNLRRILRSWFPMRSSCKADRPRHPASRSNLRCWLLAYRCRRARIPCLRQRSERRSLRQLRATRLRSRVQRPCLPFRPDRIQTKGRVLLRTVRLLQEPERAPLDSLREVPAQGPEQRPSQCQSLPEQPSSSRRSGSHLRHRQGLHLPSEERRAELLDLHHQARLRRPGLRLRSQEHPSVVRRPSSWLQRPWRKRALHTSCRPCSLHTSQRPSFPCRTSHSPCNPCREQSLRRLPSWPCRLQTC